MRTHSVEKDPALPTRHGYRRGVSDPVAPKDPSSVEVVEKPPRVAVRRRLKSAFLRFLRAQATSGVFLLFCTSVALFLANSAWAVPFERFWQSFPELSGTKLRLGMSLRDFVSDGLMTVFFLVVGLEIKRELLDGELSSRRKAALPVLGALGGMLAPAFLFLAFTHGTPSARGFGIPTATDIAFTVGVMTLLGSRVPLGAKVFLTALAIADDLGAVVLIAIFYTHLSEPLLLLVVLGLGLGLAGLNVLGVRRLLPYGLLGLLLWMALHKVGIHPTLAGVAVAAAIPLVRTGQPDDERRCPLHRLIRWLHPYVAFLILPLFALAQAGVPMPAPSQASALFWQNPISLGATVGLVVGKPLGIFCASLLAVRLKLGVLPEHVSHATLLGASMLAGIGFTMSIFITGLAFADPKQVTAAKLGVLFGSLLSALCGSLFLRIFGRPSRE